MAALGAQVIERQIAGGLIQEGLDMLYRLRPGTVTQGSGDPKIGVLHEVFGHGQTADQPQQAADQRLALADEGRIERVAGCFGHGWPDGGLAVRAA